MTVGADTVRSNAGSPTNSCPTFPKNTNSATGALALPMLAISIPRTGTLYLHVKCVRRMFVGGCSKYIDIVVNWKGQKTCFSKNLGSAVKLLHLVHL